MPKRVASKSPNARGKRTSTRRRVSTSAGQRAQAGNLSAAGAAAIQRRARANNQRAQANAQAARVSARRRAMPSRQTPGRRQMQLCIPCGSCTLPSHRLFLQQQQAQRLREAAREISIQAAAAGRRRGAARRLQAAARGHRVRQTIQNAEICPISQNPIVPRLTGRPSQRLRSCGHRFNQPAIRQWIHTQAAQRPVQYPSCPMCREPVDGMNILRPNINYGNGPGEENENGNIFYQPRHN